MATSEISTSKTVGKVRPHQTQNEALVFEEILPRQARLQAPPARRARR